MAKSIPQWNPNTGKADPKYKVPFAGKALPTISNIKRYKNESEDIEVDTSPTKSALFPKVSIPSAKMNLNSNAITSSKLKLPSFKAVVPDAKLSLKSVDDKFEGKSDMDKLNNALTKMAGSAAQTMPGKILARGQDTVYNIWDKQSGVDELGMTGRGDNKAGYITDTGNQVANAAGDMIGFVSALRANTGGGTMQGALTPLGKFAEQGAVKGLEKLAPSLPSAVNKVAKYAAPTIAREGTEGAVFGGTLGVDDGLQGVAKEALKGGVENAVFGMGLKGAGDIFSHTLGKIGKVKVTGDDGINVNYVREDGSIGIMKKVVFDKEATPLTVNEGVNTLNQSKVGELPQFKGDFNTKVTNELPTVNKVDTEVDTVKTNVEPVTDTLADSQVSTLPTIKKPVIEPVQSEKAIPTLGEDKTVDAMGATTRIHSSQEIKSSKIKEKTPIGEKLSYLYRHNVDILNDLKKVDVETFKLAQNSKKVGGTPVAIFNDNLVDRQGNPIGESLKAIKKDFPTDKEQYNDVMNYILHKHNIDRAREGKHVYKDFESDESKKVADLLEKQHPEWKALNDRLVKFINTFEEEWGHKSGLISDDAWDELKVMYKNYVPTQREFADIELGVRKGSGSSGFVGQGSTLKKATGSSRDIKDPFENVMSLVNRTVRAARYNEVGQKLVEVINENPERMARYAEIIPETEMVRNPKFIKPLPQIPGYPTPKAVVNTVPEFIERPVEINANDKSIRTVMVDGKKVNIKFHDRGLLESMEGVYKNVELNDLEKGMNSITTKFKALITTDNPFFAVRNVARDIPTAYINGSEKNPVKFFKDYGNAMRDIKKNTPITQRYRAMGGEMSNFFNPDESAKAVENLTKDKGVFKKSLEKIQGFNNAMESAPRLAEFKRTLNKTGDIQQALYDSAEVTTNFSRGGDWIKKADKTLVPYLNASVQGIDKTIRQVKNKPLATALKGATIVTLPTLFLDYVNKDNENYKALDNRTKDNNFLIPMGDTFIKLPKSREMGVLFGSLIERSIRAASLEDGSFKGFGNTIATNFSPTNPVESNIFSPILNLKGNKDFANRPIESMSLQDEAVEDRYDEKSTEPAKLLSNAIGKYAGLSPKEIDYLFKSYTGVVGQFVQPMTTKATYNGKPGNLMMPVKSSFVADPLYSNQEINDFYLNKDMLTQLANKYTKEKDINPDDVTIADSYKNRFIKVSKEMTDLSKAARESTDEAEIKRYRQQMAKIAKEANDLLKTTNRNKLMDQFNKSSLPMPNNKSTKTKSGERSTSGDRKVSGDRKLESKR